MSAGKINELVSDAAIKQLDDLYQKLGITTQQMVSATEQALKFTAAINGTGSVNEFNKANDQAAASIQNVIQANANLVNSQKAVKSETDALVAATAKKAQAEAKALNDYLVSQSKQNAAREAQMTKELEAERRQAQKLIDIENEKQRKLEEARAKRASQIGPTIIGGQGDSRELSIAEAEAIGAKTRALDEERVKAILAAQAENERAAAEQKAAAATQQATQATQTEGQEISNTQKLLNTHNGTLEENIRQQIQMKLELKNVQEALKAGRGDTAALTAEEIRLKTAISANSTTIRQLAREEQAAAGSQNQMLARLAQLRNAYNNLSAAERNNAQIGGVLLTNIQRLAAETSRINREQGKYNDSVGQYEGAIKNVIAQYIPFGDKIVKTVDFLNAQKTASTAAGAATAGLGAEFASFTIAGFALAIASATYYMQQFRTTGKEVESFIGGLKNQFSGIGSNIIENFKKDGPIKGLADIFSTKTFKGFADNFNQGVDVTKQIQDLQNLNEVEDQLVAKKQAQSNQDRAMAKNQKLSSDERLAYLRQAQATEREVIEMQKENAQANIDRAIASTNIVKKLTDDQVKILQSGSEGAIRYANDLVKTGQITENGYQLLYSAYQKKNQALASSTMALIRQQNDEAKLQVKNEKQYNTDYLELIAERLKGEQSNAKLILDDNKQSFEARLAALQVYVNRSKALIENQREVANSRPKVSDLKRQANNQAAKNADVQVEAFNQSERKKIAKEANDALVVLYKTFYQEISNDLDESINEQVLQISRGEAEKARALTDSYNRGEINYKQYQSKLKVINEQALTDRLNAEIANTEQLLAVQEGLAAAGQFTGLPLGVSPKQIQGTRNRLIAQKTAAINAGIKADSNENQDDKNDAIKKAQDFGQAIGFVQQASQSAESLINNLYEQQIALLERKKQIIDDTAKSEVDAVNNSIASEKTKQAQINIINKRAEQDKAQIDERERKIKRQQAITQKAFNIAQIIENTAVGVSLALAQGGLLFGVPFASIVAALGAVQLGIALAQPIPQFEKGGTVQKSGNIITGEAGTELRINPDGSQELTKPYANVSYAKAGTRIVSNKELMKMVGKPEPINYVGGQMVDMKTVESLLKENNDLQRQKKQPRINVNVNADWSAYTNQYFR